MIEQTLLVRALLFAAALWVCPLAVWAQDAPRPMTSVGIFSLLGESVQVSVSTTEPTDTRIERTRRESLDTWMLQAVEVKQLSHLLIVTRSKGEANLATEDVGSIGRGSVEGIGYHIDRFFQMKNKESGAISSGMLAPFVQIRVQLMDSHSAKVVSTYDVRGGHALASKDQQAGTDPWAYFSNAEKVQMFRQLVEAGMRRALPKVLKQP